MKFNWKKLLGNIAPILGTALSGGNPLVGGLAGQFVKSALGLPDNCTDEQLEEKIKNDTQALVKLKTAELKFKTKLKELGIKEKELVFDDRKNARQREIDTGSSSSVNRLSIFVVGLVVIICIGVGFLFYNGNLTALSALEASILTLIVREAFGKLEQVCNYFFGSSHGSSQKNIMFASKSKVE